MGSRAQQRCTSICHDEPAPAIIVTSSVWKHAMQSTPQRIHLATGAHPDRAHIWSMGAHARWGERIDPSRTGSCHSRGAGDLVGEVCGEGASVTADHDRHESRTWESCRVGRDSCHRGRVPSLFDRSVTTHVRTMGTRRGTDRTRRAMTDPR